MAPPSPPASIAGKHESLQQVVRFLIGGGLNTALSYVLYLVLLHVFTPLSAYSVAFVAGIFTGYTINTAFVFRAPWSWKKLAAFPMVHMINYIVGASILWLVVSIFAIDARLGPILSVLATLPINYLMTRKVVNG